MTHENPIGAFDAMRPSKLVSDIAELIIGMPGSSRSDAYIAVKRWLPAATEEDFQRGVEIAAEKLEAEAQVLDIEATTIRAEIAKRRAAAETTLKEKSTALLNAVDFDNNGTSIAGQFVGGNGGLISRETISAADELRKALAILDGDRP